jgi:hypothetical protein
MSSTDSSPKSSVSEHIHIDMMHTSEIGDHIIEESQLHKYTDDHFIHKLNVFNILHDYQQNNNYNQINEYNFDYESNSPIIMSNDNSDDDNDNESSLLFENSDIVQICPKDSNNDFHALETYRNENEIYKENSSKLKKLTFREVSHSINKYYETDDKYSNELDILTTFLKGQKNLYMKSRTITQMKLNMLMIPSFIGTSIITIFAPIIQNHDWSGAFISALNAIVALFISIVHYFKLESSAELFLYLTNQYDRLESSIEFASNKITFFENHKEKNDLVISKMKEVEKKINEIKESTNIFIPNEVKKMFPIICNVNIFSFIKRIEIYKKNLLVKFKDVKNEILYIEWKWGTNIENKQQKRLDFLCKIKEKLKDEILHYKNAYGCIDELFMKEIKRADNTGLFQIWFYEKKEMEICENHALKEYLSSILIEE